jgi:hypothetical protein
MVASRSNARANAGIVSLISCRHNSRQSASGHGSVHAVTTAVIGSSSS